MPAGPRCPNHLRRAGSRGSSPRPFTSSGSHTLPSVRPGPGPFSRPRSRCGAAARRVAPARRGGRLSASGAPSAAGPLFPAPLLRRCRQACSEMTWTRTARGPLFTAPIQSISLVPTCPPEPPAASPPPRGIRDASRGFGPPRALPLALARARESRVAAPRTLARAVRHSMLRLWRPRRHLRVRRLGGLTEEVQHPHEQDCPKRNIIALTFSSFPRHSCSSPPLHLFLFLLSQGSAQRDKKRLASRFGDVEQAARHAP